MSSENTSALIYEEPSLRSGGRTPRSSASGHAPLWKPLGNILQVGWQHSFTALGYVGLVVLVFQGGFTSDLKLASQNISLSILVALTGLIMPICISLVFLNLVFRPNFTLLQSFTAGAALSSTSLGTTFNVLLSIGLHKGRLGAVLTSAAMLDDVVGLILLKVIQSLGQEGSTSTGWAVGRPLLASVGLLLVVYLITRFVLIRLIPLLLSFSARLLPHASVRTFLQLAYLLLTPFACVAVAGAAGTSVLLGAYAGGLILAGLAEAVDPTTPGGILVKTTPDLFDKFILQAQTFILEPLFFASIGFAIPIKDMWDGTTVWQGIVYAVLMLASKVFTGIWVALDHLWKKNASQEVKSTPPSDQQTSPQGDVAPSTTAAQAEADRTDSTSSTPTETDSHLPQAGTTSAAEDEKARTPNSTSLLTPCLLLGSAMVARGEIGLLIAGVARSTSDRLMPPDLYRVSVWAILLCTIAGPWTVGFLVKRLIRNGADLPGTWSCPITR